MAEVKNKIISWINDCFKEKTKPHPVSLNWEENYESSFPKGFLSQKISTSQLIRDGLFSLFWQNYKREKISEGCLLPLESSVFLNCNPEQLFYRCERVSPPVLKPDHLLISLRPEIETFPLNLLETGLERIKNEIRNFEGPKVFLHFSFTSGHTPVADQDYQKYIHSFYRIISDKLGFIPKLLSDVDLKRMGTMETWSFYSPEAEWLIGDSFMKHFVLSKNAQLLEKDNLAFAEVKKIFTLSPFHQIIVGTVNPIENSHLTNRYETFKKANPIFDDRMGIPRDFITLVYSSRDKVR